MGTLKFAELEKLLKAVLPTMYRSVADHNDEQVIAMFMSNHKRREKRAYREKF